MFVRRDHLRVVWIVVDTAAAFVIAVGGTACFAGSGIALWLLRFYILIIPLRKVCYGKKVLGVGRKNSIKIVRCVEWDMALKQIISRFHWQRGWEALWIRLRKQRCGHCPPIISTFSAVLTDRFSSILKSLGVMTSEGYTKVTISLMCIIADIMTSISKLIGQLLLCDGTYFSFAARN